MQQHQIKFLNTSEPPASERFAAEAAEACEQARCWSQSATDAGLDTLLSPEGAKLLVNLVGRVRRRDILSPDCTDTMRQLAGICSGRIAELSGDLISPSARARAREVNRPRDLLLSDQSMELYAVAERIDKILDLQAALRTLYLMRQP